MSIESAKMFVEKMVTDRDFAEEVTACKDSEARLAFVKEAGFDFTPEEIASVMEGGDDGELNDAELEAVSGGGYDDVVECSFLPPCKEGFGDCKAH